MWQRRRTPKSSSIASFKIKGFIGQCKPQTCAVIGGGYIGLEMADNLANLVQSRCAPASRGPAAKTCSRCEMWKTDFVTGKETLIPLASPANKQARIAADNAAGRKVSYKGTQGTAIAKVFDMTVAMTGQSEAALKAAGIPYKKSYTYSASNAGYYPGGEPMFIKLLYAPESGRLLGAQITGIKGVDKRIDQLAAALRFKGTVYDLEELELAYAPPFSSAKDPVNMAGYTAENILSGKSEAFYLEDLPALPKDAVLLDVRTQGEFGRGNIEGAVNIPVDALRENLGGSR